MIFQVCLSFVIVLIFELLLMTIIPNEWEAFTCKRIANFTNAMLALLILYWLCKLYYLITISNG